MGAHDQSGESLDATMSLRYTVDGKYVVSSSSSGLVHVAKEGEKAVQIIAPAGDASDSCTCVRAADVPADADSGAYTVGAVSARGHVSLWALAPGRSSEPLAYTVEETNECMTCAFPAGTNDALLTGGSDGTLRYYRLTEGGSLDLAVKIEQGIDHHGQPTLGPPAKVMASTFIDRNTFLVGGWESSVLMFDLRAPADAVRSFDGPRLSGDALDVRDGCVLAASHRPTEQLQVFDLSSGKALLPPVSLDTLPFACRLFGRASKLGAWVAGTSSNAAYAVNLLTGETMASVENIPEAVYSLDVCPTDPSRATIGCAQDGTYRITAKFS